MAISKDAIQALTMEEKHQLLDMLWESLEKENYNDDAAEETEAEKQILRERLEDYKNSPSGAIHWENLKDDLLNHSHD